MEKSTTQKELFLDPTKVEEIAKNVVAKLNVIYSGSIDNSRTPEFLNISRLNRLIYISLEKNLGLENFESYTLKSLENVTSQINEKVKNLLKENQIGHTILEFLSE